MGIDLLERRYTTEMIRYFDIMADYRPFPQVMADDYAKMAKAFLLYLVGAYLFTNEGQTVFLRWLTLFCDFERAQDANWGQACLVYLYSSLDTLSWGTLCQLVEPWKHLKVSFFSFSFVAFVLLNYASCSCELYSSCKLFIPTSCILSSCKLYPFILQTVHTYSYLYPFVLQTVIM